MSNQKMVFINLPVKNLNESIQFYNAIGFHQNMQFSDDTAACMVLTESIYVMLLTHKKWQTFTTKQIPNAHQSAQVMIALSNNSKNEVDQMIQNGASAGGKADPNPVQDLGFMYGRSLEDPDGHIIETFWMNMPS